MKLKTFNSYLASFSSALLGNIFLQFDTKKDWVKVGSSLWYMGYWLQTADERHGNPPPR